MIVLASLRVLAAGRLVIRKKAGSRCLMVAEYLVSCGWEAM